MTIHEDQGGLYLSCKYLLLPIGGPGVRSMASVLLLLRLLALFFAFCHLLVPLLGFLFSFLFRGLRAREGRPANPTTGS